jgi:hypothetical protein
MHEHLNVGYHQQDTDYYCGAACAQMVLHSIGQPLISQDDLYNDNHSHSVEPGSWATPPDGLQWTLNHRQSAKFFALDSLTSEEAISRMLCWTLHHYGVAPVALVEGGNHWVVVRGYTASAAPTSSQDTAYAMQSFDINNPWPPTPAARPGQVPADPPPHTDGDVCGSGGARATADINVSYATWQTDYMTANVFGLAWLGKYVAVCDPDPPPKPVARAVAHPPPLADGSKLLGVDALRARFADTLRQAAFAAHPRWSQVFAGVTAATPQLVQRLDRPDSYYWIVPTQDAQGRLRGLVNVDARFGTYQQATGAATGFQSPLNFTSDEELIDHVLAKPIELGDHAGRLVLRREAITIGKALVWRPCRQSLSPFYPFRLVTAGAHRIYVRISDGAMFTALTNERGGI